METGLLAQDLALQQQYPEISIINDMPSMRVASFWAFGESPEGDGEASIRAWAERRGLLSSKWKPRIFGCDYPAFFARHRGYEYWLTIPEDFVFEADDICVDKTLPGGMYALISFEFAIVDMGDFISRLFGAMESFASWCRESGYGFAFHQYLEEMLPAEAGSGMQRMNCYFPIGLDASTKEPAVVELPRLKVAVFHENNRDFIASEQAWELYRSWSEMSGDSHRHRLFQVQDSLNKMYVGPSEILVSDPPAGADLTGLEIKELAGRRYLRFLTHFKLGTSELEQNCYRAYMEGAYERRDGQLVIEYEGLNDDLGDRMRYWLYYPLA